MRHICLQEGIPHTDDENEEVSSDSSSNTVVPESSKTCKTKMELKISKHKKRKKAIINDGKRKPSRPASWVWLHFTVIKGLDLEWPRATCNWCGVDYASHPKRNGTSNMATHLETQCKKIPKELLDLKQTTLTILAKIIEDGQGCGKKN